MRRWQGLEKFGNELLYSRLWQRQFIVSAAAAVHLVQRPTVRPRACTCLCDGRGRTGAATGCALCVFDNKKAQFRATTASRAGRSRSFLRYSLDRRRVCLVASLAALWGRSCCYSTWSWSCGSITTWRQPLSSVVVFFASRRVGRQFTPKSD